jgi:hypothetical protein
MKNKNNTRNVNRIADSIEKVHNILAETTNSDARLTWTRILYKLQLNWRDALVEIETNGKYQFD